MILLISEIKKFLRKYLPKELYFIIYKIFKKIKNTPQTTKLEKQVFFTKRGVYDFKLGDTGFDIVLDPDNGGVDSEIYSDGAYEPEILTIIKNNINSESVFVDIGANIGQHSLFASNFAKSVYSFEPIKKIYLQFCESISLNKFTNIKVYNHALGNQKMMLPIFGSPSNMGASSVVSSENRKKIQDVAVFRFDDIVDDIKIDKIDFIKIDVEGYELDVLLGAQNSIQKYKPILLIEFSPYFYNQKDPLISNKIIDYLLRLEYTICDIGDGFQKEKTIKKYSDLEVLAQTNLLCRYEKN